MSKGNQSNELKNTVTKLTSTFGRTATSRLLIGVGSGWITGMMIVRIGKPAAVVAGTSIIAFQLAQNHGLVKTDWDGLANKAQLMSKDYMKDKQMNGQMLAKAKTLARGNAAFAAGFTGGFLLGLAT